MKRRPKWLVVSAIMVAIVVAAFLITPREPRYNGRSLTEWTADLSHQDYRTQQIARAAIHAMGAAAVPFLTNTLAQRESFSVRIHRTGIVPRRVVEATRKLIVWHSPVTQSRNAAQALATIGPNANAAVPELIRALRDKDFMVAHSAAVALAAIGTDAVPALRSRLRVGDAAELPFVLMAFGYMGKNAATAAPDVARLLDSPAPGIADRASAALTSIGPAAGPATTNFLSHPDDKIQLRALSILRQLGSAAVFATNSVLLLVESTNAAIRLTARQTLVAISSPAEIINAVWVDGIRDADIPNLEFSLRMLTTSGTNALAFRNEIAQLALHPAEPVRLVASNALTRYRAWPEQK